jgi:hypothetical protein
MKKWLLMFVFLLICIITNGQVEKHGLIYVKVDYENFNTFSFSAIDCESFDYAFNKTKVSKKITDSLTIKGLEVLKDKLNKKRGRLLDIRGIITFYYSDNKNEKYCFDRYGFFLNEKGYFYNKKLLNNLVSLFKLWD